MKLILCAFFVSACLPSMAQHTIMVDSGSGKLEMAIAGSGTLAVVFESGFSDTYEYWDVVATAIISKTKTVRYNRAGFGHSPLNNQPRTAEAIAKELHAALANAGVRPPYILVGHSAGGMYVRVFAHLFPADVAGIVLVDPAPESFYEILAKEDPSLWNALLDDLKNGPAGAKAQLDANATTMDQAKKAWPLPKVPVVVISATKPEPPVFTVERRNEVISLQKDLSQRIPGAQDVEAAGCGHNVPMECPSVVSDAVSHMLDGLRINTHR